MRIEYSHGELAGEAYRRLEGLLKVLKERHGDRAEEHHRRWNEAADRMEFGLRAMGQQVSGSVTLSDGLIVLDLKLPLLARAFSRRIEEAVREELDRVFPPPGRR